jgi:hypothetical protein
MTTISRRQFIALTAAAAAITPTLLTGRAINRPRKCQECGGSIALDKREAKLAALTFPKKAYCFDCLLMFIDQEGMCDTDKDAPLIRLNAAHKRGGKLWVTKEHYAAISSLYPTKILWPEKSTQRARYRPHVSSKYRPVYRID